MSDYESNMEREGRTKCPFCSWSTMWASFRERKEMFHQHLVEDHGGKLSGKVMPQ